MCDSARSVASTTKRAAFFLTEYRRGSEERVSEADWQEAIRKPRRIAALRPALAADVLAGVSGVALALEVDLVFIVDALQRDRKSTRLNSSHSQISYAVF